MKMRNWNRRRDRARIEVGREAEGEKREDRKNW
jgi:hypothetical protein